MTPAQPSTSDARQARPGREPGSGYHGVLSPRKGRFQAAVRVGRTYVLAGTWSDARAAALARDRAALHLGLDVPLNFPARARKLGGASVEELRALARIADKRRTGQPPFLGVSRAQSGSEDCGYQALYTHRGTTHIVGRFATAKEAAAWRDRAALFYEGPEAPRNFPHLELEPGSIQALRRERRKLRGSRRSRYQGVEAVRGRWVVVLRLGRRRVRAGAWDTERAAAIARDRAVLYHDIDAELHFPKRSCKLGPASFAQLRLEALQGHRARAKLSRYVGVSQVKGRWRACVSIGGVQRMLGTFDTPEAAALARERAIAHHQPETVVQNFPGKKVKPVSVEELRRQDALNQKLRARRSSRFFGVCRAESLALKSPAGRPWAAQLAVEGYQEALGFWETEEEAAEAHDRAQLHYHPAATKLNFPKRRRKLVPADAESLRVEARLRHFKSRTSSRFRGVCWDRTKGKWRAAIRCDNRVTKLGVFDAEVDAARAYDRKSMDLRGPRGWFNFHPDTGSELCGKRVYLVDGRSNSEPSRQPPRGRRGRRRTERAR